MVEDIYEGSYLSVWKDEDTMFLAFPGVTIEFPADDVFLDLLRDFHNLAEQLPWIAGIFEHNYLVHEEEEEL